MAEIDTDEALELVLAAAKLGIAFYQSKHPREPGAPPPTREQLREALAEVSSEIVPWDAPAD